MLTRRQDLALLLVRIIVACIFFYAAYAKFPMWNIPAANMGMTERMRALMLFLSVVEPIGAAAVLTGVFTRQAAACLAVIMVGAIGVMRYKLGIGFSTTTGAGWNFPFAVLAPCLALAAFGSGRYSLQPFLPLRRHA